MVSPTQDTQSRTPIVSSLPNPGHPSFEFLIPIPIQDTHHSNFSPQSQIVGVLNYRPELGAELGTLDAILCLPAGDPQSGLHHQRHRVAKLQPAENHQGAWRLPARRRHQEIAVLGITQCIKEVDDADQGLESSAEPVHYPVWRQVPVWHETAIYTEIWIPSHFWVSHSTTEKRINKQPLPCSC